MNVKVGECSVWGSLLPAVPPLRVHREVHRGQGDGTHQKEGQGRGNQLKITKYATETKDQLKLTLTIFGVTW